MRHILFFLLSISSVFFVAASAEPIPPHVGEWNFTESLSYYQTGGNYSNNYPLGLSPQSGDLPFGGTLSTITDNISVNYDILKELRLNANLTYDYVDAARSGFSSTNSGVTEMGLGAQYWIRTKRWALVPTLTGGIPFYRNNEFTQTQPALGNGTAWVEGGAYGILYYQPVAIYAYAAYRYQDSQQAGLAELELGGSYRFDRARVRVGLRGEATVTNDNETNNPLNRNNFLQNWANYSLHFYSVNPTLFDAYVEGDYLFSRMWEVGAGFSQSVYGENTAVGWTVNGFVRFRLPGDALRQARHSSQDHMAPPSLSEPLFEPEGTEQ